MKRNQKTAGPKGVMLEQIGDLYRNIFTHLNDVQGEIEPMYQNAIDGLASPEMVAKLNAVNEALKAVVAEARK